MPENADLPSDQLGKSDRVSRYFLAVAILSVVDCTWFPSPSEIHVSIACLRTKWLDEADVKYYGRRDHIPFG